MRLTSLSQSSALWRGIWVLILQGLLKIRCLSESSMILVETEIYSMFSSYIRNASGACTLLLHKIQKRRWILKLNSSVIIPFTKRWYSIVLFILYQSLCDINLADDVLPRLFEL